MKVKVAYTVGLEEVPELIGDILSKSGSSLADILKETREIADNNLNIESYSAIVDMTRKLELIRDVYEDCYSLLGSYIKTTADLNIQPDPEQSPAATSVVQNDLEGMQKLKQKLMAKGS